MNRKLCIECKGKGLCGRPKCPILEKFRSVDTFLSDIPEDSSVFGSCPPAVFVGRYGYPNVRAGPMIPPILDSKKAMGLEDPKQWLGMDIQEVISRRCQLIRANTSTNVYDAMKKEPLLERTQELALSRKPVDTEAWFVKPPKHDLKFDPILTPMGPSGVVKDLKITENPKVPGKVDYLVYDTDAMAKDAINELFSGNVGTEQITRLLSIGLLGQNRKLVPTRWAITATDDTLGKEFIEHINDYPQISEIQLFSGGCFGNHFEIMFIPGHFSYELLEIWMKGTVWTGDSAWIGQDMEDLNGKKCYSSLAGGYYAARLAALEHLDKMRKQASVFMIREITPQYWAPLGVWVVREAARNALSLPPQVLETVEEGLIDMGKRIHTPAKQWKQKAKLLNDLRFQRTLDSFF